MCAVYGYYPCGKLFVCLLVRSHKNYLIIIGREAVGKLCKYIESFASFPVKRDSQNDLLIVRYSVSLSEIALCRLEYRKVDPIIYDLYGILCKI